MDKKVFETYSQYYDLLYKDKDYKAETDYIISLIKEYHSNTDTILELGCGTGMHASILAENGYKVEGIDLSQISDAAAYEDVYETEQIDLFTGEAKKSVSISLNFEDIKSLMDEYFNANDPDTKKDLHKRIDDQVLNHIRFTFCEGYIYTSW